jgi:hypothetical protein
VRTWHTRPSDDGTELIYGAERLPDGGVLQVGKANEELIDLLADFRRAALIVLLIFVPASFAGGAFLASRVLRPVQHLTDVAQEIVDTNRLDARVPLPWFRRRTGCPCSRLQQNARANRGPGARHERIAR